MYICVKEVYVGSYYNCDILTDISYYIILMKITFFK